MERFSPDASAEAATETSWSDAIHTPSIRPTPSRVPPARPTRSRERPRQPAAPRAVPSSAPPENQLPLHDRERLGELFARLEPRLRAVALRITRNPDAARDAVQDAFEKVLRHGHRFAGQSRVSTWMHRIVANEALMFLRSQRRRREVQADLELDAIERQPAAGPCPAERASGRQHAARLERGLSALSPEDRDVMLRCALAGESYAAYGARSGMHPAAVKSRAFRARRRLAAFVEEGPGTKSP